MSAHPPTPEDRAQVDRLCAEALALPPAERTAYIERHASNDWVRREALEMLAFAGNLDQDFLEDAPTLPPDTTTPPADALLGDSIGPYTLREVIGEGGFGIVYAAEQTEPLRRRVALKLIKPGMDSKAVVARFQAEREALAIMDHPCVAKVLDAGVTDRGLPYFVMELVKGVPITQHCDTQRLSLTDRIELFIKVCDAVQHAHTKGVIHRDLKPSNILVEYESDTSTPKVIDFGVAKALNQRLTQDTIYTEQGQLIGTPEYMSPEQAEMSAQDIDTRSDIYSLGVILYELLTGAPPFEPQTLRAAGFAEIQRIIREVEPPKPSTKLGSIVSSNDDPSTATRIAQSRRTDLRALTGTLRRDLDWVVMKCLEKPRDRRYDTANALAMELRRYLDDEPVLAGPPSASYRISKFVKRHRAGVLAGGAFVLLFLAAFVAILNLSIWALAEKDRAEELATAEARRSDRALAAVTEMLASSGVFDMKGITVGETARLDLATSDDVYFEVTRNDDGTNLVEPRWIDPDRTGDPAEAVVELLSTEAVFWTRTGMERANQRANELQQVADFQAEQLSEIDPAIMGARMRRSLIEAAPEDRRKTLENALIAINFTGFALQTLEENILGRTIDAIDTQFADQPLVQAQLLQTFAETLTELGLIDRASEPQQRALTIRRRVLGDNHPDTLSSINNMGFLFQDQGKLSEAEQYYNEALTTSRQVLGDEHPETIASINHMGVLLQDQGKLSEAKAFLSEALATSRRALDDEHPATLTSMHNMGFLLQEQGMLSEAEPYFREVLETRRRVLGTEHPDTLNSIHNMGLLLKEQGKLSEAEQYYNEALATSRRVLGDEHPDTLASINNMGALLQDQGMLSEAEQYYSEALEARRRVLGTEHPETLNSINNMGFLLQDQGKLSEAEPYYNEALEARRRVLGDEHPETLNSINNMGFLLQSQDKLSEAEQYYNEALTTSRRVLGDKHPDTLISISNLGRLLCDLGRLEEAQSLGDEAVQSGRETLGNEHLYVGAFLSNHARTLSAMKRYADAEVRFAESFAVLSAVLGEKHPRTTQVIQRMVNLYTAWNEADPDAGHDQSATKWQAKLEAAQAEPEPEQQPESDD